MASQQLRDILIDSLPREYADEKAQERFADLATRMDGLARLDPASGNRRSTSSP